MGDPPSEKVQQFLAQERAWYDSRKKAFNALSDKQRRHRLESYAGHVELEEPLVAMQEVNKFMSFEEFIRFRESRSSELCELYTTLMQVPGVEGIRPTGEIDGALRQDLNRLQIYRLSSEERWTLQLYAREAKFLPMGVLGMVKEKRVKWQMVL
ncbi:hypothetical protein BO71DRAFT_436151 [Aspergillus ellipticus CBS 707.79]|uniref:Uncharacterized protein n=1 Tax=Aspergillus ellipticus CBS 707.79 TaxID=1448320 RepID=A0A319CUD6_9EURO|nr:hypothetical protein BO71DRAFT_436151 [Aspergillus ellipticus CBS 707.79]